MTENLLIHKGNKEDKYKTLLPQIASLLEGENDLIAAMANVAAALALSPNASWLAASSCRACQKSESLALHLEQNAAASF